MPEPSDFIEPTTGLGRGRLPAQREKQKSREQGRFPGDPKQPQDAPVEPPAAITLHPTAGMTVQQPTGFLQGGELHLDEKLAPKVPDGAARPFAPGEYYLHNPGVNDELSSEMTMTVQQADGRWINIPGFWLKNGKPYVAADEDEALSLAEGSGLKFIDYPSEKAAVAAAEDREAIWQKTPVDSLHTVSPLWGAADTNRAPAQRIVLPDLEVTAQPNPLQGVPGINLSRRQ